MNENIAAMMAWLAANPDERDAVVAICQDQAYTPADLAEFTERSGIVITPEEATELCRQLREVRTIE